MILEFTLKAFRDLSRLSKQHAQRIITKMEWFAAQENPLKHARALKDKRLGMYRFRIGDYRVLVDIRRGRISILTVLAVRHRKDAYRL